MPPPQPGTFTVHTSAVASSSRIHDDMKKDKKRKDFAGRLGKEMVERRDDGRQFAESITELHAQSLQLAARPEALSAYTIRLYPLSIERSALIAQAALDEKNTLEHIRISYNEEREKVEAEFKRGQERIRERLLEGIEERRKRAREEKDGDGTVGDASLDSQSRQHLTRKLRNKHGGTPPPTTPPNGPATGTGGVSGDVVLSGPTTNPLSLSVDELPSPFPLPLTAPAPAAPSKRSKKGETREKAHLGKASALLVGCKDAEAEMDLGEIRRQAKRRRAMGNR